jgi:hypothetical protein
MVLWSTNWWITMHVSEWNEWMNGNSGWKMQLQKFLCCLNTVYRILNTSNPILSTSLCRWCKINNNNFMHGFINIPLMRTCGALNNLCLHFCIQLSLSSNFNRGQNNEAWVIALICPVFDIQWIYPVILFVLEWNMWLFYVSHFPSASVICQT